MPAAEYLAGHRFGRWTVLGRAGRRNGRPLYALKCDCGHLAQKAIANLASGASKSCGCLRVEDLVARVRTHGESGTPAYAAWKSMHRRCRTADPLTARNYADRGIKVCARWKSFERFLADMGSPPFAGATLERRSNSRGYFKSNCRWASKAEQSRNTSRTLYVHYRGSRRKFVDAVDAAGLPYKTAYRRYAQLGWSVRQTLETPVGERKLGTS